MIAIDGPAGSGKSTLAALLARRYNYTNIETGAMYRALAFKAIEDGVSLDDEKKLAALAASRALSWCRIPKAIACCWTETTLRSACAARK